MPAKTYTVQSVHTFNPRQFVIDGDTVVGFVVEVELNMGSFGISQTMDIWQFLPNGMKTQIQSFYDRVKEGLSEYYLGQGGT